MSEAIHLHPPVTDAEVAKLKIGDIVYLTGKIFTMRDRAHERLFEYGDEGKTPPVDLRGAAIWHCGPVVRHTGKWEVTSVGPTTSYRFTRETPRLLKEFGVRVIVGKGGMGPEAVAAIKETGSVFLAAVGGCAGVYAKTVTKVEHVHWEDMGLPEAIWELNVEKLGALVVAIDGRGESLYREAQRNLAGKLDECYDLLQVDPATRYIYWPPRLWGTPEVAEALRDDGPGGEG